MHPTLFSSLHFAAYGPALAGVLLASVWQGLLLTVLVALGLRLLPGLSSSARSAVWTTVLLVIAASPALLLLFPHPAQAHGTVIRFEQGASFAIVTLWSAASVIRASQLIGSVVRLRGILRRATPIEAPAELAEALKFENETVSLCLSADVDRPSVAGFLRPRILLPPDLLTKLSGADLGHIVLHEMEHLRRHDDWLNLLQQITLALFPLNPALLWLNRRLSLERELACDDGVLQATRARKAYAACLARVAESSLVRGGVSLALSVLGDWKRRPQLAHRVERILQTPTPVMGRVQMRLATGAVFAGVLGGATLLSHSPELVSFVPAAAPGFAQVQPPLNTERLGTRWLATSTTVPAPRTTPASTLVARPRLVKAVLPMRPQSVPGRSVHHEYARSVVTSHAHRRAAPWMLLTDWRSSAPSAPAIQPAVRLVPVTLEDSQIWYTAIAYGNGWIVVQL